MATNDLNTNVVHTGDCFDILADLPAESVHAVVTDPPYGLAFMGRDWDDFSPKEYQQWCEQWADEIKRVLKPGGHLLAFSGNRTHHRLFTGVEDAGFEIRDTLTWHYGSGFPKASDISKTIDKRADADREVVGTKGDQRANVPSSEKRAERVKQAPRTPTEITEPATNAAKQWDGFKTGLKPATEYVVMARKPFTGATVDCVLQHGTGALNIDECRIDSARGEADNWSSGIPDDEKHSYGDNRPPGRDEPHTEGRYPSNVIFDETEAERLDRIMGELSGGARTPQTSTGRNTSDAGTNNDPDERIQLESGGPSRYFYTSKASKAERTEDGSIANAHPTVKPTDLMEWLVKLVTAEGQVVLDPFAGSGTTLKAAKGVGRKFVGIEKQPQWADVARVRAGLTPNDPTHVRDTDDAQEGLEAFQ